MPHSQRVPGPAVQAGIEVGIFGAIAVRSRTWPRQACELRSSNRRLHISRTTCSASGT